MANGDGKTSGFLSTTTALVSLISILLGAGGSYFWMSQKDLAEHQTNQIKIALSLLSEENAVQDRSLRRWAVNVIDYYSPVDIPQEGIDALVSGDASLPEIAPPILQPQQQQQQIAPSAAQQMAPVERQPAAPSDQPSSAASAEPGSRFERVMGLQNAGLQALLDGDLRVAVETYESAYKAWPTFRNLQEIRDVLRRRAKCVAAQNLTFDGDVRTEVLYRLRVYDLSDVDPTLLARLKADGRWSDKPELNTPCVDKAPN